MVGNVMESKNSNFHKKVFYKTAIKPIQIRPYGKIIGCTVLVEGKYCTKDQVPVNGPVL